MAGPPQRRRPAADAGSGHHGALDRIRAEELRDEPVPREDRGDAGPGDAVNERGSTRRCRVNAVLEPQPEPIEAPRRRPADERPERDSIHDPTDGPEAG